METDNLSFLMGLSMLGSSKMESNTVTGVLCLKTELRCSEDGTRESTKLLISIQMTKKKWITKRHKTMLSQQKTQID